MERSKLTISTSESFQSISNSKVNCCICLEDIINEESYMPDCNHSWCFKCNEMLNKNSIEECPICKNKFKSILKKGRWKTYVNYPFITYEWEAGREDSKTKLFIKKIQKIIINFFGTLSFNRSLGGLSV